MRVGLLASCWATAFFEFRGGDFAPAGEFLFVCDGAANRKKEPKSASADGWPAELAAFLRHFAQTAAGDMKDFQEVMKIIFIYLLFIIATPTDVE